MLKSFNEKVRTDGKRYRLPVDHPIAWSTQEGNTRNVLEWSLPARNEPGPVEVRWCAMAQGMQRCNAAVARHRRQVGSHFATSRLPR